MPLRPQRPGTVRNRTSAEAIKGYAGPKEPMSRFGNIEIRGTELAEGDEKRAQSIPAMSESPTAKRAPDGSTEGVEDAIQMAMPLRLQHPGAVGEVGQALMQ